MGHHNVDMLLFLGGILRCYVFGLFSYIFRSDAVFLKNEKPYSCYIDSGGSKCCYFVGFSYDYGNTRFSAGAFSMKFFQDFNGKIMCIGGAQGLKTMEILLRK